MRIDWLSGLRSTLGRAPRRRVRQKNLRQFALRTANFELLEDRRLLAVDFGDAPDIAMGTGVGNYNTLSTDNGPQHTIVAGLRLGANVDGDTGAVQNLAATADDVTGALPDDEDGITNPAADLVLTVAEQPAVNVRVTNTTGSAATLYGWIDYNANGVFENSTERTSVAVPDGTNNGMVTLTFPEVPMGYTGTTYARFRLSTDVAAANPLGMATDGEVEDYRVTITNPTSGLVDSVKTTKIASDTNGGPTLANNDYFGRSVAAIGDVDGDGVTDLAVGANGDDNGGVDRGAIHILLMNADGSVKSEQKINHTVLAKNGDSFGVAIASLGDLDGDGIPDISVGIESSDLGAPADSDRGAVFVVFLNSDGSRKAYKYIYAGNLAELSDGDHFGHSMSAIGDLDGDGVNDLAVGADRDDSGGADRGAVYVLFMNGNGTVKSKQKIASGVGGGPTLANSDRFGSAVASLGDIDGDGVGDLAVGAVGEDTGGSERGAVHILFMNSDGTVKSSQKIGSGVGDGPSLGDGDQFGAAVAAVGDLDGDGVNDLAVGANYDDTAGQDRGAIYLLFMNSNGTVKSSQKIASGTGGGPTLSNDDRFGPSVTSLGDLDGDGLTDLAVGADFDDTGGSNRGAVYALFLQAPVANTDPVFTSPTTASVSENTTSVMTVTADDAQAPPQTVTYSIVGGADQAKFSITDEGALSFASPPDFEVPTDFDSDNTYVVTVQADDGAGGTATQTIEVTVEPVNEHNPVFTSVDHIEVPENSTSVLLVSATDADLPVQQVTFEIVGGEDRFRFLLSSGGDLSFRAPPDFEIPADDDGDNVYVVAVQADDGAGGTTAQTINITVTPVNDNVPFFTTPKFVSVPELSISVLTVTASDLDVPAQPVTFSITGGEDGGKFSITSGGDLTFNVPPDFKHPTDANGDNIYMVTILASDNHGESTTHSISIRVTSLNTDPVFTSPTSANVAENSTTVMTVTATDEDLPPQTVTYSLVGGADQSKFSVTAHGDLSFLTPPDFESPSDTDGDNVYELIVQADDGAGGTATQTIDVTVSPVNDNTPVFTSPNSLSVPENTSDVLIVTATDADLPTQTLTYSIVGGADQSRFNITNSGLLSFKTGPDFEAPIDANGDNVYVVTVQASDGNGETSTQTINVAVTPVNDNEPVFTSLSTVYLPENTTVVLTVSATDADVPAQSATFSLVGGTDQSKFSITENGILTFNSAPDFEMPGDANGDNVYVVTVEADDGHGGTTTQTIDVTVTPVNDNKPVFTAPTEITVPENNTDVLAVTATDADLPAQPVTFFILGGGDASEFTITTDGHLSFQSPPDFEAPTDFDGDNTYVVNVVASDGGGALSSQTINVTVTPVNDNDPVFTSPDTASVPENSTAVMTVTTTDADLPPQAVTFSLVGGDDQAQFSITSAGELSFVSAPDFEVPLDFNADNIYEVTVQADDGAGGTTTQTINVAATPVNDNAPTFTSPDTVSVPETSTAVMMVTATDADIPSQTVTFSLVGGDDQLSFTITSAGELSFVAAPDFELPGDANGDNTYDVIVQASDGSLATNQAISVTVTNVNGPAADFDDDGDVDGRDFLAWQRGFGTPAPDATKADGDADDDLDVDSDDLAMWQSQYDSGILSAEIISESAQQVLTVEETAVDRAFDTLGSSPQDAWEASPVDHSRSDFRPTKRFDLQTGNLFEDKLVEPLIDQ